MNAARTQFRRAAAVILVTPNVSSAATDGQKIQNLLVQRSANAKFLPSSFVFPGGEVHKSDFSPIWEKPYMELFKNAYKQESEWIRFKRNVLAKNQPKPPIFNGCSNSGSGIPPEWAFKVCALRELYEETGILVLYDKKEKRNVVCAAEEFQETELRQRFLEMRNPVRHDPNLFMQLFQHLPHYCLAFWILKEWMNWLTPAGWPARQRFDTVFYLLCADGGQLKFSFCSNELQHAEWTSPLEALRRGHGGEIWLPPPQIYELSRLANFHTMEQLHQFAEERECKGMSRHCHQIVNTTDGFQLMLLPGDGFYNDVDGEHVKPYFVKETAESIRDSCEQWNHAEFPLVEKDKFPWTHWNFYQKNIISTDGHMEPSFQPLT